MKQLDDVRARNAPLRGMSPAFLTNIVFAATAASIFYLDRLCRVARRTFTSGLSQNRT